MIHFFMLISKQGKVRLSKWYNTYSQKDRAKITKEISPLVLQRAPKLCNFLDWRDLKVIYKRYASLYFVCVVDPTDNELIAMDMIHLFVEVLDKHFGNVCELDLVFNFYKAYWLLDEVFLAGELQEPSKKSANAIVRTQDEILDHHMVNSGQSF